MEMLVIGVVAILAFAAVLIPLFRRGAGPADADEFGASASGPAAERPPAAGPPPAVDRGAEPGVGEGGVPPMASGPGTPAAPAGAVVEDSPGEMPAASPDEIELEVQRYRAALRAGTICSKCGQANPADSGFCFECGAQLPRTEAREFE